MQETLLACVPAILVIILAVVLRLRRSRREASEEIAAHRKKLAAKLAALEYPDRRRAACAVPNWINHELEQELAQTFVPREQRPKPHYHEGISCALRQHFEEDR